MVKEYLLECAQYPREVVASVVEACDCCCDGGCFEMKDGRRKVLTGFVYRDGATLASIARLLSEVKRSGEGRRLAKVDLYVN